MKVTLFIGKKKKEVDLPCTERNIKEAVRKYCQQEHLDVSEISYDLPNGEKDYETDRFTYTNL